MGIRVTSNRSWLGINADVPHGTVERDVKVKDTAVNKSKEWRLVATPPPVVHTRRFMPHSIPKGVDLNISTAGHVCTPEGLGCPAPAAP